VWNVDEEKGRIIVSTRKLETNIGDMMNNRLAVFDTAEEMASLLQGSDEARRGFKVCESEGDNYL
jgi:ribosomal protein S1